MALKNRGRTLAAGLLAGVLVGGGFAMVTPAGAAVKEAASAINWKNIWQTQIKPRADKRYFTKKKANVRFYTKFDANALFETKAAHDASLVNYYTKAQSDANYYTKAQSDAKYAPKTTLLRGTFLAATEAAGAGVVVTADISFGITFSAAPAVHLISPGDPLPAGCLGTAAAPDAAPGHLCVFQTYNSNVSAAKGILDLNNAAGATAMGAVLYAYSAAAGQIAFGGSWAARPVTYSAKIKVPSVQKFNKGLIGR